MRRGNIHVAPTNAFDALPEGTLEALLEDTDALANILLYHVAGETQAGCGRGRNTLTMVNGDEITIEVTEAGLVLLNGHHDDITDIEGQTELFMSSTAFCSLLFPRKRVKSLKKVERLLRKAEKSLKKAERSLKKAERSLKKAEKSLKRAANPPE